MIQQATVTLNPGQLIGEVHDHLYGANLEHLGQAIYGGVWAEMLRDRKFLAMTTCIRVPALA